MRKIHLFIHSICLVAITCLVLERRTAEGAKADSIKRELTVVPKPSPVATKAAVNASPSRRSRPGPELDPVEQILREYGEGSSASDKSEIWEAQDARYERLMARIRVSPPEPLARLEKLDRDWKSLSAAHPFRSFDLRGDISMIGAIETAECIEGADIEVIRKKLETSRLRVPAMDLPILEKIISLVDENIRLGEEAPDSPPETELSHITDSLSDDEMASVSDNLVAMVLEGHRLSKLQQKGELRPKALAAWEILAEKVNRDFAALAPEKPKFEDWMQGETQVPRSRLSDRLIEFWRDLIQRPPEEEVAEEEEAP